MVRGVKLVILIRLSTNSFLMNKIFENTLNEEHDTLFLVKIQLRKLYSTEHDMKIKDLERDRIQNVHYMSHNESLNSRDYSCGKQVNGQIMLKEKEINFVWRVGAKESSSSRELRKKLPRN